MPIEFKFPDLDGQETMDWPLYWLFKDGQVKPVFDLTDWASRRKTAIEDSDGWVAWARVADDRISEERGLRVSTVFLGMNHSYDGGPPLLFETMVFRLDEFEEFDIDRYATYQEALMGHEEMCQRWLVDPLPEGFVTSKTVIDIDNPLPLP
jgi:hypothetical protein